MNRLRLIQVGLAICLMASLLTASPAACTCSHPDEAKTSADCRFDHEDENLDVNGGGDVVDDSCTCTVEQRTPFVASRSESKDLKGKIAAANVQYIPDLDLIAATTSERCTPSFTNELSYSNTLRSLLPSRAPPRL